MAGPSPGGIRAKGAKDEGDIALGDGIPVAIESKAVKAMNLAGWMQEIEAEVANSGPTGASWWSRSEAPRTPGSTTPCCR